MELAEFIESKVMELWKGALKVINSCLAGTATCGLWDLLENIWGPDLHLGPEKLPVADEDDEYEDEEEEDILVEEGASEDSGPAVAPTRPIPEEAEGSFNPIQEVIEASLQTAAQEATAREGDTPSAPLEIQNTDDAHSSQAVPHFTHKRKAPIIKGSGKRAVGDKVPLNQAVPLQPTSKSFLPYNGVDSSHISAHIKSGYQSVQVFV